jgi:hypothetical protein
MANLPDDLNDYQWTEPAPEPMGLVEWLVYLVVFFVLGLEFAYMWEWCQWFTRCPRT